MTHHQHHNAMPQADEEIHRPSRRTELVRAAADGELAAPEQRAFRDHLAAHPDDAAVVAFEQDLRRAIAAGVAQEAPSPRLRATIARMAGAEASHTHRAPTLHPPAVTSRRVNRPLRWLAIAASVGLIASVAYLTLRPNPSLPGRAQRIAESHRVSLVSFMSSRHTECELHADKVAAGFRIHALDKAPAAFTEILGRAPDLGRLAQGGLKFMGAESCAVPGRGRSVHMVFEAPQPVAQTGVSTGGPTLVSVFIQQDRGELQMEPGRTYRLVAKGDFASSPSEIYTWKHDGLVYFLASTSPPAIESARLALGAQKPSGDL